MRYLLVVSSLLLGSVTSAHAQVAVSIGLPSVQIGINVPVYPDLVRVPGYPVYYAPRAGANYFFYDGAYWVYAGDNWYASSWYNGPWHVVSADAVPLYVLRVPVRYYRRPPPYFRGWRADAPPRWGEHWGHDWERRREGWDRWDRRAAPRPAPMPVYQRSYAGDRYPGAEHQHSIRSERYPYQPREDVTRQHYAPAGSPGHPGSWHAEPQHQGPPSHRQAPPPHHQAPAEHRPAAHQPPHDNGRRNDVEPHDRGRQHHEEEGRGRGHP
jgi:hypothetical protein